MSDKKCDVEVFSRVTGFFRPVQSWNKGKTEEFADRKRFNISAASMSSENDSSRTAKTVTG
jgi:ribonucleoside-triphosphate reductase (formate)